MILTLVVVILLQADSSRILLLSMALTYRKTVSSSETVSHHFRRIASLVARQGPTKFMIEMRAQWMRLLCCSPSCREEATDGGDKEDTMQADNK